MLNLGVASSLLQSIEKYVSSNMLLIDMEGKIMSGPKVMRGKTNALARQLVSGAEEMVPVRKESYRRSSIFCSTCFCTGSSIGTYTTAFQIYARRTSPTAR